VGLENRVVFADNVLGRGLDAGNSAGSTKSILSYRCIIEGKGAYEGLVTTIGIERGRWGGYNEPWFSFRIAAIAFRPRSFSTRSGFISASP
jgi:hypothetical protein